MAALERARPMVMLLWGQHDVGNAREKKGGSKQQGSRARARSRGEGGLPDGAGEVHKGHGGRHVRRIGDDGLERDEEGALRHAASEAAGDDVERFQPVGVAVPAEEEGEVADGGDGDGENGEALVAAGSGQAGVSVGGGGLEGDGGVPFDDGPREQTADGVADHGGHEMQAGFGVGHARGHFEVDGDGEHELGWWSALRRRIGGGEGGRGTESCAANWSPVMEKESTASRLANISRGRMGSSA